MRQLYGITEKQIISPKTAHIELFEDGRAVLFDYERRDPLSNNAYTETIQLTA